MLAAPAPAALSPTKVLFADSFADDEGPPLSPRGAALHRISASGPPRNDGVEFERPEPGADASHLPAAGVF